MDEPQTEKPRSVVERLDALVRPFEERRERAAARLAAESGRHLWFAILGLLTDVHEFEFPDQMARLQPVEDAPGEIELAGALKDSHLFGALGRYAAGINYELGVNLERFSSEQVALDIGWSISSLVRLKSRAELLIPAVASHSWSVMAAITDGSCHVHLIEDVPLAKRLSPPGHVSTADLQWAADHLIAFTRLRQQPSFQLAVESLTTHHLQASERMMAAAVWTGIEALFGVQSELRYRIATLTAAALEPRGTSRTELYRQMKKMYSTRSAIVHGSPMKAADIVGHVLEAREILCRLLCCFIEDGEVPEEAAAERAIFE